MDTPKLKVSSTCQPSGKITKHVNGMEKPVLLPMNHPKVLKMMLNRIEKPVKVKKQAIIVQLGKFRSAK